MNKTFKKIWNITAWCLVFIVVILAILLAGIRLFGFQVFAVLSGSMEPEYHTGSLIYVREVDTDDLKVNDVITFMLNEDTIATHRIVELVQSEEDPSLIRFRTKGDANEEEDGTLVHPNNVIGKPAFTVPCLGYLASFIQNPPGTYVAISVGAILVLLVFLPDLLDEDDAGKKKSTHNKKKSVTQTKNVRTNPTQSAKPAINPADLTPAQIEQLRKKLTPEQMEILMKRIAKAKAERRAAQNRPRQK